MRLAEAPAATVPDAEHIDHFSFYGEKYPVDMRLMAVEQLPHFKRDRSVFGGQFAASG
jgi:hypothetical protein